jgi:hypothetical protein
MRLQQVSDMLAHLQAWGRQRGWWACRNKQSHGHVERKQEALLEAEGVKHSPINQLFNARTRL